MMLRIKALVSSSSRFTACLALLFIFTDTERIYAADSASKRIVFIAGKPSHDYGSHEHFAGSRILADVIQKTDPNAKCDVIRNGWPTDESVLDTADAIDSVDPFRVRKNEQ